jgi:hypothetical protein
MNRELPQRSQRSKVTLDWIRCDSKWVMNANHIAFDGRRPTLAAPPWRGSAPGLFEKGACARHAMSCSPPSEGLGVGSSIPKKSAPQSHPHSTAPDWIHGPNAHSVLEVETSQRTPPHPRGGEGGCVPHVHEFNVRTNRSKNSFPVENLRGEGSQRRIRSLRIAKVSLTPEHLRG